MIPHLKPFIGQEEFLALFSGQRGLVEHFEKEFAQSFGVNDAIAFPYGRSALWAFLQAMGIRDAEVLQPAYTCSVVGHATVLSGNRPRFVDIRFDDYNMDLDQFRAAINAHTRVVIPTHLFGYPMDVEQVAEIVQAAEKKYGQRIYVIQDCAHSFEAEWQGHSIIRYGDGALFGLGISKQITSIFGGMFTTNDEQIAHTLKKWRDDHFKPKTWQQIWMRRLYLLAIYPAFSRTFYGLTYWLQTHSPLLKPLTDAYHLDEKIHFPPDFRTLLADVEASVGMQQLAKYPFIKRRRQEIADIYFQNLVVPSNWILPARVAGATYSHFVIRVPDREAVLQAAAKEGVQLGQLIEYSMPHHPAYRKYAQGEPFPNSLQCSHTTINLPMHPGLTNQDVEKIIMQLRSFG